MKCAMEKSSIEQEEYHHDVNITQKFYSKISYSVGGWLSQTDSVCVCVGSAELNG